MQSCQKSYCDSKVFGRPRSLTVTVRLFGFERGPAGLCANEPKWGKFVKSLIVTVRFLDGPRVLLSQEDFLILKEVRPACERMSQNEPNLSKKVRQIVATLKHTLYDLIFGGWTVGRSVAERIFLPYIWQKHRKRCNYGIRNLNFANFCFPWSCKNCLPHSCCAWLGSVFRFN